VFAQVLEDETLGMLRAALRILPDDMSRLVLVIDQFEELFTLVEDEAERRRFLVNLVAAMDDPHARVVVVLTLRADSYHKPLGYMDLAARLASNVVNVLPLTSDELEAAAQEPAARNGVTLEPALLAELLADVIGEPGALPIFQYALTELFDRRESNVLTVAAYRAMGGVRGALSRRADDLYHRLTFDEQEAARQLFLRLVSITEHDDWGRRRVPASEIVSMGVTVADSPIRGTARPASASSRSSDNARCAPRLSSATAWISSTITVSTVPNMSRPLADVSRM